ncbi:MAG: metal-dependent hydrolase, partial [Candidatus Woesearchaeota archaeon]
MAFAFVHLTMGWLFGKFWEATGKKELIQLSWILLLLGAILPDIDFLLEWTITSGFHRTFTHSLVFALVMTGFSFLLFYLFDFKKKSEYSSALGVGILIHLFVDLISFQGIPLLWPLPIH